MKSFCTVVFSVLSIGAAGLFAQSNPLSADTKQAYTGIKNTLMKAAEKMPAENYSFRTVPAVRTYGEMISHIADVQYLFCGFVKGEKSPVKAPENKSSKTEVSAYLKSSFDYCDAVYDSMTDAAAPEMVKMFGRDRTKLAVLNANIAHNNEMYGNMVAFLRIKGIVPPSSEGRP